jgi:hypothetical protein
MRIVGLFGQIETVNVKQKGQSMIATLLKWRVGSGASEARMAAGAFLVAACVFPALISFWLLTMQLTPWQLLVSMVATASLGFQLLVLSFLCRILRPKNDAA